MSKVEELYEAVKTGRLEAVENFLSQPGINPNKRFENGSETMISAAVRRGSVGIVDLLVQKGANVNLHITDKTPLHMASYNGDMRLVKALVGYGATLETCDHTNRTAIHWAARQGHYKVFKYLKENKASLAVMANDGNTLLHDAALGGDADIVELLMDKLTDVQARNNDGHMAQHLASSSGHSHALHTLLKQGAMVDDTNSNGENILHIAARMGNLRVVKFICEKIGVDISYINKQTTDTCLTKIKDKKCVTKRWTALHFACAFGHLEIVKYLLNQGADKSIPTKDKLNALEVCGAYKQKRVMPLLLDKEAEAVASKRSYMSRKVHVHDRQRTKAH